MYNFSTNLRFYTFVNSEGGEGAFFNFPLKLEDTFNCD